MPQRLIIDTDAGVDDAIGIMMALAHPDTEVAAVTAVTGNVHVDQVMRNVSLVLDVMGRDVPLYRGAARPLVGQPLSASDLMGADGLGNVSETMSPRPRAAQDEKAALALVRLARESQNDGPLTLAALGPLTNVALAVRLDPLFASRISRLVVMGGTSAARGNSGPAAEFNFAADPEAAAVVFEAGFPDLWVLPWETAVQNLLLWPNLDALLQGGAPRAAFFGQITGYLKAFLQNGLGLPGMPLPDPLAVAAALQPQIVTQSSHLPAAVETGGALGRGLLALGWTQPFRPPNAHIITQVDFTAVMTLLQSAVV
jgi:purine nucleosidase